jgi:FkbH-like protein
MQCSDEGEAVVTAAPFDQVMQTLLQPSNEFWRCQYDAVIVWTSPGSVIGSFENALKLHGWSLDELRHDVDRFVDLLGEVERRADRLFLASWSPPAFCAHGPSIEAKHGVGAMAAIWHMNARLAERLADYRGTVLFNIERWLRQGGAGAYSDKLWFLARTPYSKSVFDEAVSDMIATLRGMTGQRRKVIIVDLDNVLWGGVVGDVGWEALRLGGHDPVGEAYVQFQRELKHLSRQGVILAIASKNEDAIALEAIDRHPEMILRRNDFAAWRINWNDKAENIGELLRELNLGLDSVVFLDDSRHERSRVRQALPAVLVPEWPSDAMDYPAALRSLRCFESATLTAEDRTRTAMYTADRERRDLQTQADSLDAWLATLSLEVSFGRLSSANLERAAQLLNKTNQMNLTTRRLSTQELAAWAADVNHQTWTFSVRDKIGDYGLCGLASLEFRGPSATLVDFVLSCRAMGRGVEEVILSVVAEKVREAGAHGLAVSYVATKKNRPCIRWIEQQPCFVRQGDGLIFLLDVGREIPAPEHIRITSLS